MTGVQTCALPIFFEQASIAKVLLLMVRVNQEAEYLLCRELAEHSLGRVPEPGLPPQ